MGNFSGNSIPMSKNGEPANILSSQGSEIARRAIDEKQEFVRTVLSVCQKRPPTHIVKKKVRVVVNLRSRLNSVQEIPHKERQILLPYIEAILSGYNTLLKVDTSRPFLHEASRLERDPYRANTLDLLGILLRADRGSRRFRFLLKRAISRARGHKERGPLMILDALRPGSVQGFVPRDPRLPEPKFVYKYVRPKQVPGGLPGLGKRR